MQKLIKSIICILVVDFFYFSTGFTFLPESLNTKMIFAVLGLIVLAFDLIKSRDTKVPTMFIIVALLGMTVSLCAYLSMTINSTSDDTYVGYVISMSVWWCAAYFTCWCLRRLNGGISIDVLSKYIVLVCVFQCALTLLIDNNLIVKRFVDMMIGQSLWLESVHRLRGFGDTACLDTAGIRYSFVLIVCLYQLCNRVSGKSEAVLWFYSISALFIFVVGNMVARTTIIGLIIGLLYLLYSTFKNRNRNKVVFTTIGRFALVSAIATGFLVYQYNTSPKTRSNLRFAFEGFFALYEKGEWETSSTNKLQTMYVFPDNAHTWLVGDGYIVNPYYTDKNYLGENYEGYYKNTDVGYLRFIFYMGLLGLACFSLFIICAGYYAYSESGYEDGLPWLAVLLNFVIWFKVATDCFFMIALLICTFSMANGVEEDEESPKEGDLGEPSLQQ